MLCFYLSFLRCQKLTFKTAPVKTVICFLSHMLLLISNSKCPYDFISHLQHPPEASPFCLTCYISYTKANVDFYIATTFSVDAISCKNHGTRCKWSDTYCNRSDKKKINNSLETLSWRRLTVDLSRFTAAAAHKSTCRDKEPCAFPGSQLSFTCFHSFFYTIFTIVIE